MKTFISARMSVLFEEILVNGLIALKLILKYLPIWLVLSLVCYYATFTIMKGSIFNPLIVWINNQFLAVEGLGNFSEIFWHKITVLFSCFHCLGTWVGFIIGAVFTFIFGIQIRYIFNPSWEMLRQLQKDERTVLLKNTFKKLKFLILRPFFTLALIIAIGFCVSAGSLGWYSIFNYPKHRLELIRHNHEDFMDLKSMYFEEALNRCDCAAITKQ